VKKSALYAILIISIITGLAVLLFFPPGGVTTAITAICFGLALFLLLKIGRGGKNGTRG